LGNSIKIKKLLKILLTSIVSTTTIVFILAFFKLLPYISLVIKRLRGLGHLEKVDGEVLDYTLDFIIPTIFFLNIVILYLLRNKFRYFK